MLYILLTLVEYKVVSCFVCVWVFFQYFFICCKLTYNVTPACDKP